MSRLGCRLFCVAALVSLTAHAETASDSTNALVEAGVQLRREGRDLEALEKFRRANEIDPMPKILAQIALAEQALGRWSDAEEHLNGALAADGDTWIRERRDQLGLALQTIEQHLGSLTVETNVVDAELWIDGFLRGKLPLAAQRVSTGSVRIEVRRAGAPAVERTLEVSAGARVTEHVEFVPRPPAEAAPPRAASPPSPAAPHRDSQPHADPPGAAWALLGGAGMLLAGAVAAQVIHETAVRHYNDDKRCLYGNLSRDERCGDERGRAETAQMLAVLGYAGAGVLGGASVVLFAMRPASNGTTTSGARPQSALHVVGLEIQGRWQ